MKMFIRSNTAVIMTAIKDEDYEKFKDFKCFIKKDKETGDMEYALSKGLAGNINEFSATCNTTHQGNLAVSLLFDGDPEEFAYKIKPMLVELKKAEVVFKRQMEAVAEMLASVDDDIEME